MKTQIRCAECARQPSGARMLRALALVAAGVWPACGTAPAPWAEAEAPPRPALSAPISEPDDAGVLPSAGDAEAPAPCREEPRQELAHVSCDGTRIETAHPIELHPERPVPAEPSRGVLTRVAEILRSEPDILLVRIEVSVGDDVGGDAEQRRQALARAQRRADAIFGYLWHKQGISAERLEAVAYEHDPRRARGGERWPVVLRIVQRARR